MADFVDGLPVVPADDRALVAVRFREEPERLEFDHLFFCGHLKAISTMDHGGCDVFGALAWSEQAAVSRMS